MLLVDVHAHLDLTDNPAAVVVRAKAAGVKAIINAGVDTTTNEKALALAKEWDIVKPALGFYPDQIGKDNLTQIEQHAKEIVAISECGLDFKITDDPQEQARQRTLFLAQIKLANILNLPLIVHTRKAEKESIDLLEEYATVPVILHCFEGSKKLIERAITAGFYLTITPNIARSHSVQLKADMVPLKQLLTETDTPFMGPKRDEPNEPANVRLAIDGIAAAKKITPEECANAIFMNYKNIFG